MEESRGGTLRTAAALTHAPYRGSDALCKKEMQARQLLCQGMALNEISRQLNCTRGFVQRIAEADQRTQAA